jgi:predicted AAA+ superfamily ATPase
LPALDPLRPRDFANAAWRQSAYELAPFPADLVGLWELFLTVGGFPRAVWDYLDTGAVSSSFVQGLWQVIYGEALRSNAYPALQIQRLLSELAARLTAPTNFTQLAEDCGFADHSVASERCDDLVAAYVLWPCYPVGSAGLPRLNAQRKFYFYDPLLARLAALLDRRSHEPSLDALSEQQVGLALLRALEREKRSAFADYSKLMFMKTPSRNEIDFVGPDIEPAVFESRYLDSKKTSATAAIRAQRVPGIMASRAYFDPEAVVPWLPAALLVWMLDGTRTQDGSPQLPAAPAG